MFSGIIEEKARVASLRKEGGALKLLLESHLDHSATNAGDSICIDGVCLTVTKIRGSELEFDVSEETARRSTLPDLRVGARVNLERSLALGGRLHGHLVYGHVDRTVCLRSRREENGLFELAFELPEEMRPYIVTKGSVALAGVSLTVGAVNEQSFVVYIIPHTAALTTLPDLAVGDKVNLEIDMLARYVQGLLFGSRLEKQSNLLKLLAENGYLSYKFS